MPPAWTRLPGSTYRGRMFLDAHLAARTTVLMALMGLTVSCSDPAAGDGTLLLGWTFVDGRRCAESGVEQVAVLTLPAEEALLLTTCASGHGAATRKVSLPAGEHQLRVAGLSATGATLYRATESVELEAERTHQLVVQLVFVGGR